MFQRIYQKLQTREGITLVASVALIVLTIGFVTHGWRGGKGDKIDAHEFTPSISVSGTGEMNVSPDIAQFTFSVSKDAATIASARDEVTTIGNDLIAKLKAAGIAEKDIKAENLSTYPKYENKRVSMQPCTPMYCPPSDTNPVIVGYTVSINYSVKVRDLDQVSKIAELLTNAKLFSLNGPNFSIDDVKAVQDQAREKAIDDAKAQAKVLARQLGVRLGKIVDFQVDGAGGMPVPMYDRAMNVGASVEKAVAPELPTGETKVTSNVVITYSIR